MAEAIQATAEPMDVDEEVKPTPDETATAEGRKLFVKGFKKDVTKDILRDYFMKYGAIKDVFLKRVYGFITFEESSSVDKAMAEDKHVIKEYTVILDRAKKFEPRAKPAATTTESTETVSETKAEPAKVVENKAEAMEETKPESAIEEVQTPNQLKVFIPGILDSITKDDLKTYFSKLAEVDSADIVKGKRNNTGMVIFKTIADVDAVQKARPHLIGGRKADTFRCVPVEFVHREYGKRVPQMKLFIGGVNPALTEANLKDYFGKFGPIQAIRLRKNFAFVDYYDHDAADKVLQIRQHKVLNHPVRVDLALANDQQRNMIGSMPMMLAGVQAQMNPPVWSPHAAVMRDSSGMYGSLRVGKPPRMERSRYGMLPGLLGNGGPMRRKQGARQA